MNMQRGRFSQHLRKEGSVTKKERRGRQTTMTINIEGGTVSVPTTRAVALVIERVERVAEELKLDKEGVRVVVKRIELVQSEVHILLHRLRKLLASFEGQSPKPPPTTNGGEKSR